MTARPDTEALAHELANWMRWQWGGMILPHDKALAIVEHVIAAEREQTRAAECERSAT